MLYITVPSFKYGEEITTFPHFYLSAVPVYNILKAILIYISQKTSYLQTRFACHYYTHLFRRFCYIYLLSHNNKDYYYTWTCVDRLLSGLYILILI